MKTLLFAPLLGFSTFLACGEEDKDARTEPEGANPGECTDGADNDFDGDYDCNDSDCSGSPDCLESDCDDGADNDQDGDFDCDDSDCADAPACVDDFEGDEAGECTDGVDNDSDGLIDCEDPNCEGSPDCESTNDADGDGFDDINAGGDDCDDSNPNIHPMAGDTYGDGVDSDCDNLDCESASDGSTYFTVCGESNTWLDSHQACQNVGYDGLASISDGTEMLFIESLIPLSYNERFWIGYQ